MQLHNNIKKCFEIPVFFKYIVFISIKTNSPHERNLSAETIGISGAQFFCITC